MPRCMTRGSSRSSVASRYLARRARRVTVAPVSTWTKFGGSGKRRSGRLASTRASRWPSSTGAKPRRTVSTSGSSGMAPRQQAGMRLGTARPARQGPWRSPTDLERRWPGAKTQPMTGPAATFGFRDVDPNDKPGLVRGVFDRVASRYDLMNDLMRGGVHRLWKDAVAGRLEPQPGETIIACAGGTGDMARRFSRMARRAQLRRGGADAKVVVVDYNAEMIAAGRQR